MTFALDSFIVYFFVLLPCFVFFFQVLIFTIDLLVQKQPPEMSYKKDVLKNFPKLKGKRSCQSLLFNKVQACLYLKRYSDTSILLWSLWNFLERFFTEHIRATASVVLWKFKNSLIFWWNRVIILLFFSGMHNSKCLCFFNLSTFTLCIFPRFRLFYCNG